MAVNASAENKASLQAGKENIRIFTFWVEDGLYGIDIANVLTVSQETSGMRPVPGDMNEPGVEGMIEYLGRVVPVIDFANALGFRSNSDRAKDMAEQLKNQQKEHEKWFSELEDAVLNDKEFNDKTTANTCQFGRWLQDFETRDDTLKELTDSFVMPHRRLHALAAHVLEKRDKEQKEDALKIIRRERETTLARFINRFELVRNHMLDSVQQVYLYVTEDGVSPTVALRIDHINDVLEFKPDHTLPMSKLSRFMNKRVMAVVKSYLQGDKSHDAILVDPMALLTDELRDIPVDA